MRDTEQTVLDAYNRQEEIYASILELVKRQLDLFQGDTEPESADLVQLCAEVEGHLDRIARIESEIESEKAHYLESDRELPPALVRILSRIEQMINETKKLQREVQLRFSRILRSGAGATPGVSAGGTVGAHKARQVYGSAQG
jgi:hypothetical protein